MKKKAFTLTELLIVVVVVAVLSAVAVPQYKKVVETRKVGEAEAVLTAVRNEQERRCTTGKAYASLSELQRENFVPTVAKNFDYSAGRQSLSAESTGAYNYILKVASYRDGRICCLGEDCNKFNYPDCQSIENIIETADECNASEGDVPTSISKGSDDKTCFAATTTEWGECSAHGGIYTEGGTNAFRTKTTKADCSAPDYSQWDISKCSHTVTDVACECSEYGGEYGLGGAKAKCQYVLYGDGHQDAWTATDTSGCMRGCTGYVTCSALKGSSDWTGNAVVTYQLPSGATGCLPANGLTQVINVPNFARYIVDINQDNCKKKEEPKYYWTTTYAAAAQVFCGAGTPCNGSANGLSVFKLAVRSGQVAIDCQGHTCWNQFGAVIGRTMGTDSYYMAYLALSNNNNLAETACSHVVLDGGSWYSSMYPPSGLCPRKGTRIYGGGVQGGSALCWAAICQ